MANVQIIVGSMLGATEYVADAVEAELTPAGHQVTVHLQPDYNDIPESDFWLVCTSTHGAGDLPDNIEPFAESLKEIDLSGVKYAIIGIGDSCYDTFCGGAIQMQDILTKQGAKLLRDPIHIDVLEHPQPEDHAVSWVQEWLAQSPELIAS